MNKFIPLSIPHLSGNEWNYVKDCLDTNWISSVGSYVDLFEEKVAEFTKAKYAVATVNGTAALHICLVLEQVKPGDYVIVPNITFIATANAVRYTGAEPIFIDVDADTWQMDLDLLSDFLETKTTDGAEGRVLKSNGKRIKAIMPVHVLGNITNMSRLLDLAQQYNLAVIEDSTEALGSYYQGKHAGTLGKMGCISFNGNKIITTGGGGMILTDEEDLALRAKHLTTQAKADKLNYFHDEIGYNYRLVNVLAAIGVAQMEHLPKVIKRKKEIATHYHEKLKEAGNIAFQKIETAVSPNHWLFTIKTKTQPILLKALNAMGIQCRPLWVPMNQLPMFKENLYVSENDMSNHLLHSCLSIPCTSSITKEEVDYVADSILKLAAQKV